MIFWLAMIAGLAGAFFGIKKQSFYAIWAILFNLMVSIYVSVMLARPVISLLDKDTAGYEYQLAISILLIAAVLFALLQIIAVSFFTSYGLQFSKTFDKAGSAVLGFIIGFLTCSYFFFIICIMPVSRKTSLLWPKGSLSQAAIRPVIKTCDLIAKVSLQRYDEFKDTNSLVREIITPGNQPDQPDRQLQQSAPRNTEDDNIPIDSLFPE